MSSHGLPDFFQTLLDVVDNLHCSLWDPGSGAKDGADAALIQEFIVLHKEVEHALEETQQMTISV